MKTNVDKEFSAQDLLKPDRQENKAAPQPKTLVIVGPTASGKTALAVAAAHHAPNGEVVNCDSMQLYAAIPTLTAQPSMAEREGVPHHLFGVLQGGESSNAARYIELARPVISRLQAAGVQPILCGGTGLYLKALVEGLAAIPPIPAVLHQAAVELHSTLGGAALRQKLRAVDPDLAERLADGDTQRLIRAWEVWQATGTPLSVWQRETHLAPNILGDWRALVLMPPRAALYEKINARFQHMLQQGALDEVRALLAQNLPADLPLWRTVGLPELRAHLDGLLSEREAVAQAQQSTRHYAKRQVTWFKHQLVARYPQQCRVYEGFGNEAGAMAALKELMA